MSDQMQALVFLEPAVDASATRVTDVDRPEPGPGQVAIEVCFAGVNFKDVMARRGDSGYVSAWPFVAGLEVAGRVSGIGDLVEDIHLGDLVLALTNSGGFAQTAIANAALVVPVPAGIELAHAAVLPGAVASAVLLVETIARARPGDTLLVHSAAGGVGRAIAQVATAAGVVTRLGTVGAESRVEQARAGGYDAVFVRGPRLAGQLRQHLAGRGVDIVLDPLGIGGLEADLEVLEPGGRTVLFGNASGEPLGPLPPPGRLFAANASIAGFSLSSLSAARPDKVRSALLRAIDLVVSGDVTLDPTVLPGLHAVPAAHDALAAGAGMGKYVVAIGHPREACRDR